MRNGKVVILLILALFVMISCQSNEQELKEARENVKDSKEMTADANRDLNQAIKDSIEDYTNFKLESENSIKYNEQKIAEIKIQIAKEKRKSQADYTKLVTNLEQRNENLKKNLQEYKETGKDKWATFKIDFKNNLDEVGKSISDFFNDKK